VRGLVYALSLGLQVALGTPIVPYNVSGPTLVERNPDSVTEKFWPLVDTVGNSPGAQVTRKTPTLRRAVQLPAGTGQGRNNEYFVLRLVGQLAFRSGLHGGEAASIIASTNGKAANLVSLTGQEDGVRVFYSGYLGGTTRKIVKNSTALVDYSNYVRLDGLTGGANLIDVTLDSISGALVEKFAILPGTGLYRTPIHYEQLTIDAPKAVDARAGDRFSVRYSLGRRGERPDQPVEVVAEPAGGPITLSPLTKSYDRIGHGLTGTLTGVAREPGTYQLKLSASGGYNEPFAIVAVNVRMKRATIQAWQFGAAGATASLTALIVVLGRRRRRASPSFHPPSNHATP
jgi:hypothetical protein